MGRPPSSSNGYKTKTALVTETLTPQRNMDEIDNRIRNTFSIPDLGIKELDFFIKTEREGDATTVVAEARNRGASIKRTFLFSPQENKVRHDHFFIEKAEKMGQGHGKELFRKQLDLYDKLGIDKIETSTTRVGNYAWAKYGFNANQEKRTELWNDVLQKVPRASKDIPEHMAEIASFRITKKELNKSKFNREAKSVIREKYSDKEGNALVGKYILFMSRSGWDGELRLKKGSMDRSILESYIGGK